MWNFLAAAAALIRDGLSFEHAFRASRISLSLYAGGRGCFQGGGGCWDTEVDSSLLEDDLEGILLYVSLL
jgi:hypothetical protein